jgi:dihydrofolate reductase
MTAGGTRVALIWAMARDRSIGLKNALPWRLPADLRHFRALTTNHPILMGRKTYQSLGRPLPNRTNVVITRDPDFAAPGCLVAHSLDEALSLAAAHAPVNDPQVFVIGGENLYAQALARADRLYITLIEADIEGDAWFPEFNWDEWQEIERVVHPADEQNAYACTFLTLERKKPHR